MKTGLNLILEDTGLIELCRILMDRDADAALVFLQQHRSDSERRYRPQNLATTSNNTRIPKSKFATLTRSSWLCARPVMLGPS
jgi:hypothetical protein